MDAIATSYKPFVHIKSHYSSRASARAHIGKQLQRHDEVDWAPTLHHPKGRSGRIKDIVFKVTDLFEPLPIDPHEIEVSSQEEKMSSWEDTAEEEVESEEGADAGHAKTGVLGEEEESRAADALPQPEAAAQQEKKSTWSWDDPVPQGLEHIDPSWL